MSTSIGPVGGRMRAQSMLEMLSTYAWAILIISLFILVVIALTSSTSNQSSYQASCTIQPLMPCSDIVLTNYSSTTGVLFYISFTNDFQNAILFTTPNSLNITTTGVGEAGKQYSYGSCVPGFALSGSQVICTVKVNGDLSPPVGTVASVTFTISYNLCQSDSTSSCSTSIYKSTGYGSVSVAPAKIRLYQVSFVSNDVNGITGSIADSNAIIYLNGLPYASGWNTLLTTNGVYSVYSTLPSAYTFNAWSTNTVVSYVTTPNSLVSNMYLLSNVVLTETGTSLSCYVCYHTSVSTLICPNTCTKTSGTITYPDELGTYACGSGYEACT